MLYYYLTGPGGLNGGHILLILGLFSSRVFLVESNCQTVASTKRCGYCEGLGDLCAIPSPSPCSTIGGGWFWIAELVMATCVFVTMHFISQSRATRFAAAYALGSISLFLFGLALYAFGEINLLRYYWFRFPDVIIPFMIAVSIALVRNYFVDGRLSIPSLSHSLQHRMQLILSRGVPILLTLATLLIVLQSMDRLRTEIRDSRPVLEWIAENTPKQAIFLVHPSIADFYIYAQRAMFVSFRHFPGPCSRHSRVV